jgi:NADPH-ferrihemoprotein reductase
MAVNIYWGSETGTGEFFGGELAKELTAAGLKVEAKGLEDFDPTFFTKHKVIIMIVATYGEGGPTANAEKFHRWMRSKRTKEGCLANTSFAVMGLGDMNYTTFNKMGEEVDRHLQRLGGIKLYRRGIGDASQDLEQDFEQWKGGGLIEVVKAAMATESQEALASLGWQEKGAAAPDGAAPNGAAAPPPSAPPAVPSGGYAGVPNGGPAVPPPFRGGSGDPAPSGSDLRIAWVDGAAAGVAEPSEAAAKVLFEVKPMTAASTQLGPRRVEVALDAMQSYAPCGNIDVLVPHSADLVTFFLEQLGLADKRDKSVAWEGTKARFPTPCTVEHALTYYLDLAHVPLQRLDAWRRDGKLKLLKTVEARIGSHSLAESLKAQCGHDVCLTFREFWAAFCPVGAMVFEDFMRLVPLARPRSMTLAAAPPSCARFVCSIVQKEMPAVIWKELSVASKRQFVGLASAALQQPTVPVFVRPVPSLFRIEALPSPCILVGAGSGAAPFRAVWQSLPAAKREQLLLVFGAREPDDMPYLKEIEELKLPFAPAYSRKADEKKVYVQDRLAEMGPKVQEMLSTGGMWICGSEAMSQAVLDVLRKLVDVNALVEAKRIVVESWG